MVNINIFWKGTVPETALYLLFSVRDVHFHSPTFRRIIVSIYPLLPKYNYLLQDFMCIHGHMILSTPQLIPSIVFRFMLYSCQNFCQNTSSRIFLNDCQWRKTFNSGWKEILHIKRILCTFTTTFQCYCTALCGQCLTYLNNCFPCHSFFLW